MPPPAPLIALRGAAAGFGGAALFRDLDLSLAAGERICLVGRNGCGKSTLLRLLSGDLEPDAGTRQLQAGARVAYLPQDPALPPDLTVADFIGEGLPPDAGPSRHPVDALLVRLSLDGSARLGSLSGGEGRRAALGRAMVGTPQVLLLDEPTNHLDLPTIEWLEQELLRFRGALLVVSHDRAFLQAVSRATLWLERGQLRRLEQGFAAFDAWAEQERAAEAVELERLGKTLVREQRWLARGITARRRRNQGRLARLQELRRTRAELLRARRGQLDMAVAEAGRSGETVIEAEGLSKGFATEGGSEVCIVETFSTRIRRQDRIGIVGRNGAGKTTLVNLLLGRLAPDAGRVRLGSNLEAVVFDQRRESLDPEATLWRTLCPGGGDSVMVGGRQRHVVAYLRDFLFEESQARQPVKALSGGEKNRLLLARLFARPSNLLVLDEPTNDLDMETLDLLTEVLDAYEGTLLLVSHDRAFLDRLATSVILLDGRGGALEYPGGYGDAMRQAGGLPDARKAGTSRERRPPACKPRRPAGKLGYREQRELDELPETVTRLTRELAALETELADPGLYGRDPRAFAAATRRLEETRAALSAAEERWLELEEKREALAGAAG